ncbi:FKBP-type peptidyl-prolyl cis-trans isomerase [Poriferisphaera sp. WC338]|uniref:FKBP-type peptidyl-prolyl cis-trans isomerase n=1 Tax=Poriferisphaera sp. WC338 TaxID=3425129 RepID=UPI003D815ABB
MNINRLALCGVLALTLSGGGLLQAQEEEAKAAAPATQPAEATTADIPIEAKLDMNKISFALGMAAAEQIKNFSKEFEFSLNKGEYIKGMQAGMSDNPETGMSQEEMQQMLMAFQQQMMEKRMAMMATREAEAKAAMAEQSKVVGKEASEAFLAANKEKEGVQVTPSGLQYIVVEEGEGESPVFGDQVIVDYRGTFVNGEEFDSSYKRNQPFNFTLGVDGVIRGWVEGLQLMKPGAKYKFFIPANLAYGDGGGRMPDGAALVFDVDLKEVQKGKDPAAAAPPVAE